MSFPVQRVLPWIWCAWAVSPSLAQQVTITTPSPLPPGMVGRSYSQTFTATGGSGQYTWSRNSSANSVPAGLTVSVAGVLSGTPTSATSSPASFSIRAEDVANQNRSDTKPFNLTILPSLSITTSTLPAATQATLYDVTLQATGGTTPYTWSLAGALPAGVALNSSTGRISGLPLNAGTFDVSVTVTESSTAAFTATKDLTLTVAQLLGPTISTVSPLPPATAGRAYSTQISASGGLAPYTWSLQGTPPAWASISGSGVLSGTPPAAGTVSIRIRATDALTLQDTKDFSLTVNSAPSITTASPLPSGTAGQAYTTNLVATGGIAPLSWTLANNPSWLSINASSGALSGTPPAAGVVNFTARVTDANSITAEKPLQITIVAAADPLVIVTSSLPDWTVGRAYAQTLQSTGGSGNNAWSISNGQLPAGLTLNPATGAINGTPAAPGTFNFTARVESGQLNTTKPLTLTINPAPSITTTTLPNGTLGQSYNATLVATGGTGALTWSATSSLPTGLGLNPGTGAITGTPSAGGTTSVTFQITDSTGATATKPLPITIAGTPVLITTASLPAGSVNQSYAATLEASGGTGSGYNWTLAAGSSPLPGGLTLNPATGLISGTPTAPTTVNITVRVTDSASGSAQKALTLTIAGPPLNITTTSLPSARRGVAYTFTLQAEGGIGSGYAFSLAPGSSPLPAGLSLSAGGSISGTPSQAGTANVTIQVRDGEGATATRSLSLSVADSDLVITSTALPRATIGSAYSSTLAASGGSQPYTWSVSLGVLPPGLSLNPTTGAITGTPTTAGTFNLTIQVRDTNGVTSQSNFSIPVISFSITTSTLPRGTTNSPYGATLDVENAVAPVVFSLQSGTLPAGVSLNPNGQIGGTPVQSGSFNPTFQARDASGTTATRQLVLEISSDLALPADSLPGGTVGTQYPSTSLRATGGSGSGYVFSVTPGGGALPAGLTLTSGGVISGNPSGPAGTSTFTIRVTDSSNATADRQFSIAIGARGGALSITTTSLENSPANAAFSTTLAATGGTPPYTWSVAAGSNLPPGLQLSAAAGTISGTPTTPGNYSFTIRVQDSANPLAAATRNLSMTIGPAAPSITTPTIPSGSLGTNYATTLAATGGVAPFNWSVSQGELPPGVTLVANSGQLTGIPTIAGTYVFTVRIADSAGVAATRSFTLVIAPSLTITTSALAGGTSGVPYSQTLAATGGTGTTFFWVVANGSLPPGLTLAPATGIISGTPTSDGTTQFGIQVSDQAGNTATRPLSITIGASLNITTDALPSGAVGVSYNQRVTAAGGMPPLQWSLSGVLPVGLTFNPATGTITGTPTTIGSYEFTLRAQDATGTAVSKQYSVAISEGVTITTPTVLPGGAETATYSQTLAAVGGTAPYRWSLTIGTLPSGLSFDPSTGRISGVPASGGSYSFIVQVTDAAGQTATKAFTLAVGGLVSIATPSGLPASTVGVAYNEPLVAAGGVPPYTWSLTADSALPEGITLASTGVITGTPVSGGSATFTVQVTDSQNVSATKSFTLNVVGGLSILTSQLQPATAGVAYAQGLSAAGGQAPYTWGLKSGGLPPGLTLSADGIISGTPSTNGDFSFTAEVTDSSAASASMQLTLTVGVPGPPPVLLSGIPETLDPASQPRVNVSLASGFPAPITGTLSVAFETNAAVPADDPALLFTNGSRSVQFTIPANSTQPQLPNGLAIQSGTVAGTVRLSVRLRSGDQDITPDPAPIQVSTIRRAAPMIRTVTARRDTQASQIVVDIVGFATSREVAQGTFRFTPAPGVSLQTTELTVQLADAGKRWYESDDGKRFGSLFTLSQRFTVQGNLNDIANVTVTLSNAEGSSQAVSVNF
jgi:hypothetical protein